MDETLKLFGNTGDVVWAVDANQKIVLWNEAAEACLGYSAEEVLGRSCYEFLRGNSDKSERICKCNCQYVIESKNNINLPGSRNLRVRHVKGHKVHLNASTLITPLDQKGKRPFHILHICRPLTLESAQHNQLHIHLLGPVQVFRENGELVSGALWKRIKVRALLAYLTLNRDSFIHREQLLDILWPEQPYASALQNLNSTVYRLRRSLEPNLKRGTDSRYVLYQNGSYALNNQSPHWLDVDALEKYLQQARQTQNLQKALQAYQKGIALFRGDYLADLTNTNVWSAGESLRLQEMYLSALEELAALYEKQHHDQEAEDLYLKILSHDPYRESAHRQLMQLAIRRGERATAVARYHQLADTLLDELNVLPSPQTRAIFKIANSPN